MAVATALRIEVTGVVQGVGFRPFVYRLANELNITGVVGNDAARVFIEAVGQPDAIDEFVSRLSTDAPPLARVDAVNVETLSLPVNTLDDDFHIVASRDDQGARTIISPDSAVCSDCVAELFDHSNRRFGHPFITCTNCGPRHSIISDLPYDRYNTTMVDFEMCQVCRVEYEAPTNRRYHAQPIGCHDCGPQLSFGARLAELSTGNALIRAASMIRDGGSIAVKGIGGYHLMCDATNTAAVAELRRRKNRPDKPFAIMVRSIEHAREFAELAKSEVDELTSPAAPIVLAKSRQSSTLPSLVAPGSPLIGMVLGYTPVHHLLLNMVDVPLVVTSANPPGAPLSYGHDTIRELFFLYDAILDNDRDIRVPVDDSVVRLVGDTAVPLRRARGYAPIPVTLPGASRSVLAAGGELKNTFCLASGDRAWVSQHIGDMENLETLHAFEHMVDEFTTMNHVEPEVIAVDGHPGYLSSKWGRRTAAAQSLPILEVQHHHAHIAAVMAEHQLDPHTPVVGVAFDGTGYGSDGTIWGGEVLVATATSFTRVGHLRPAQLPGGDAAIQNPNRVALAQLAAADIAWADDLAPLAQLSTGEQAILEQQLARSINCIPTTSMGRLFDAVASLLGLRHHVSYEAQAAIELEVLAQSGAGAEQRYSFVIGNDGVIDQRPVLAAIVSDLRAGRPSAEIAWCFHDAVAAAVAAIALRVAAEHSLKTVVLSGGVFQNTLLAELCTARLATELDVRTHRLVPANDGGLSLGQAFIASHSTIHQNSSHPTEAP